MKFIISLSEIHLGQKNEYCIISFLCGIWEKLNSQKQRAPLSRMETGGSLQEINLWVWWGTVPSPAFLVDSPDWPLPNTPSKAKLHCASRGDITVPPVMTPPPWKCSSKALQELIIKEVMGLGDCSHTYVKIPSTGTGQRADSHFSSQKKFVGDCFLDLKPMTQLPFQFVTWPVGVRALQDQNQHRAYIQYFKELTYFKES